MKKDWIANEAYRFPFPQQLKPFTTDENGIPEPWDQCWTIKDWFISYFTVAAGDAFDKFYNNYDGLLDSFANYWGKIASEYRNYSSVLGYDLLNGNFKIAHVYMFICGIDCYNFLKIAINTIYQNFKSLDMLYTN